MQETEIFQFSQLMHRRQASISISPGQVTVLPNTAVQFTVAGACSGQPLRAIHISVDGGNINEQSFSPVPYTWPGAASGTHTLLAQVACSDDLQWQHGASGTASIVVVQPTPVPPPPAQPTPIPPPPAQPTPVPPGQPTPVPPVQSNPTNVPVQVQPTAVPPSQNGGGQINGDGVCSPQRELVTARMIVIVNNKTPSDVLVHNNPVKGSPIKFTVPVQHLMSIISGPKCDNGWTFWEVGYNGNSGWAVESTASGYNYVPNGTSLPYYGSEGQPSGSNGNLPPPAAPPPSGNGSCGSAPATRMDVGGRGDVTHTDGTPDRIHQSPSVHSSPAGEPLAEGTQFTVLQGPTCGDGYQFWRVRADDGREGWVAEGDSSNYFIEPIGNPNTSQQPSFDAIACNEEAENSSWSIIPQAYAASLQCTQYVSSVYPNLPKCWEGYPVASKWADWARDPNNTPSKRNCGLTVNPQDPSKGMNPRDIYPGDIVVWAPSCGYHYDKASTSGHVAVVVSSRIDPPQGYSGPPFAQIVVNEANWPEGAGVTQHTHSVWQCMSFIHGASNVQAKGIAN